MARFFNKMKNQSDNNKSEIIYAKRFINIFNKSKIEILLIFNSVFSNNLESEIWSILSDVFNNVNNCDLVSVNVECDLELESEILNELSYFYSQSTLFDENRNEMKVKFLKPSEISKGVFPLIG